MELITKILAIILWAAGGFMVVIWAVGIRLKIGRGQVVETPTATIAALLPFAFATALLLRNPLHLLWLIPSAYAIGFVVGLLSSTIGALYVSFVTLGLSKERSFKRRQVLDEFFHMLVAGTTPDDAMATIAEKYPQVVEEIGLDPFIEEAKTVSMMKVFAKK